MKHLTIEDRPTTRCVTLKTEQHGIKKQIVIRIYPGGIIGLGEYRRRKEYRVDVGTLYVRQIVAEVMEARRDRKKARRRK